MSRRMLRRSSSGQKASQARPSALISTGRRVLRAASSNDIGLSGAVEWRIVMAP